MKVIVYEGLFGFVLGKYLSRSVRKCLPGVTLDVRAWHDKSPIPSNAFILGHSFGGYRAICMASEYGCAAIITIDTRGPDFWNDRRRKSSNLKGFNFYQTRYLPVRGYKISSMFNIKIRNTTHMGILKSNDLAKTINEIYDRLRLNE